MSQFIYWQKTSESPWVEALASTRDQVVEKERPQFATVLSLSRLIDDTLSADEISKITYHGDFYADFDGSSISQVTDKVRQFVDKLLDLSVEPASLALFATGGRGYHVHVPISAMVPKFPAKGVQLLPYVFKEIAFELYVDTLDLRVYSAKKGRQWRVPNIRRDNGNYKVSISFAELQEMTEEKYLTLVSAPRPIITPKAAQISPGLALLYEKARLKVEGGSRRRNTGAKDLELLKRFKGELPPTLRAIMGGEGIKAGVGFHSIAMQVAIACNALGKTEEQMLDACKGLIENHTSDGSRYGSPRKREDELVRLHRYMKDSVCYAFGKGAVKALVAEGVDTADLDGMPDDAGERLDQAPANDTDNANAPDKGLDLRGGIEMRETGLYKKDIENGVQLISDIAFKDVRVLLSLPSVDKPAELWGFEAEVLLQGKSKGRQQIDMTTFLSKQRYQEFAMRNMGVMKGNDNDVAGLSTILRDMGVGAGQVAYVTRREGLDYIVRPDSNPPERELLWAETSGVYAGSGPSSAYIFRPQVPSGSVFQADIMNAPRLSGSPDEVAYFKALFQMNDPTVVAPLLGWMTACYHRMIYHALYGKFPLCQVWGQAGSGKSETTKLVAHMHAYSAEPVLLNCREITPYFLQVHSSASASIPMILDEYKPRNMKQSRMGESLPNVFRNAYNNTMFGKGGEGEQIGQGWKSISKLTCSTPIVFVAEAIESEPAIMERTISVPMSKSGTHGRKPFFTHAWENRSLLARAGRSILHHTLTEVNLEKLKALVDRNTETASAMFKPDTQHRVIFNLGVILTGFDFFSHTLRQVHGGALDIELARLRESILTEPAQTATTIMAEASKVLDTLAYISSNEDPFSPNGIKIEKDYVFSKQAGLPCIDIKMQSAYVKYAGWCRLKGQQPLYDNFEAFCHAMAHYAPIINKVCLDSPLKESGLVRVFRFSLQKLKDEGVQAFKGEMDA